MDKAFYKGKHSLRGAKLDSSSKSMAGQQAALLRNDGLSPMTNCIRVQVHESAPLSRSSTKTLFDGVSLSPFDSGRPVQTTAFAPFRNTTAQPCTCGLGASPLGTEPLILSRFCRASQVVVMASSRPRRPPSAATHSWIHCKR